MKRLFKKFTKLIYPLLLGFFVLYIFGARGTGNNDNSNKPYFYFGFPYNTGEELILIVTYFFLICFVLFWVGLIGQTCILGSEHRKTKNLNALEELFGTYFKMVTPTILSFGIWWIFTIHIEENQAYMLYFTGPDFEVVEYMLPYTVMLLLLFALTGIVGTIVVECKINRKRKKEIAAQPDKQEDTAE